MKKAICIILLLLIMMGVSGCMHNESGNPGMPLQNGTEFSKISLERMEKAVMTYLNRKYGETFEMDKLLLEFSGQDIYYRAVFHSTQRPEKGVLYCRETGEGTSVQIDGIACVMADDYANVILQERYAAELQAALGEGVLVKCRFKTPNSMISYEDFTAGLQTALENPQYDTHIYMVVLADSSARNSDLREKAEAFMGQMNVYRQYLYVGYQTDIDLDTWESAYLRNFDEFESYVTDNSDVEYVEYTAFHAGKGIVKQMVVKE